ncbi:cytidylate kinase [hydrocarbon metagenome]|uniref:(d)CMP kinase n=1 Tax=hydrocarbon metagenome TaxID=938273 RepID=A0A0W8E7V3_9ZZZZ
MKIAIDGPAGAGKSTAARQLAAELGYVYIDTGAMYRALTWKAIQESLDLDNEDSLYKLAKNTEIHFEYNSHSQRIICDGQDVSDHIRSPLINVEVSKVASKSLLRTVMVAQQRKLAESKSVVMDGRDIGEYVLPDADYKFFLTARIEKRVMRRAEELRASGYDIDTKIIEREIIERDLIDSSREMGALKVLQDSIVIDTSDLSVTEVVAAMKSCLKEG